MGVQLEESVCVTRVVRRDGVGKGILMEGRDERPVNGHVPRQGFGACCSSHSFLSLRAHNLSSAQFDFME